MDSLFGLIFSQWIQLLKENKFNISPNKIIFLLGMTINSVKNSMYGKYDRKVISKNISDNISMPDPVFILGHWRSGTTFLHNLISQDKQFNYPRIYQVINPFSFIYIYNHFIKKMEKLNDRTRPMDNVKSGPLASGEEEFAIAALTLKSPIVGWVFPKRYDYYERYLDFKDVNIGEVNEWKNSYMYFLKKICINDQRRLILKSPANTARIKLLLEMFPNAKFINIHRNPFDVYNSTQKLHTTAIVKSSWQANYKYDVHKRIINTYKRVYNSYMEDVNLITKENFVDVAFEDVEKTPIKEVKRIYDSLNLDGFEKMKPELGKYIDSVKGYKKNQHSEIEGKLSEIIYSEWKKYFEYWKYDKKLELEKIYK
ncbi:sulfotransferase domain protein [bacterium BMS3Abin04]|nr:sulfotransferase domain protein [bacterium BMS3Abin04]